MKRLFLDLLASLDILHHVVTTTTKPPGDRRGSALHLPAYHPLMLKLGVSREAPCLGGLRALSPMRLL